MQKDPEVVNVFEYMLKIQYRAKICLTLLSPNYFNHLTYPPQIIMLPVLVLKILDIHLKNLISITIKIWRPCICSPRL